MSGGVLFGFITVVAIADLLIALRFSAMASRAESEVGATRRSGSTIPPEAARRLSRVLFTSAPLMWLVVALLSFGIIPIDGITPIKF